MANTYYCTRTNYFRVTDEDEYKKLFSRLCGYEDEIHDFSKTDDEGRIWHGFGAYSDIDYLVSGNPEDGDDEYSFDTFLEKLQKILPENEAVIYMSVDHEKLRFVEGFATICTNKEIRTVILEDCAVSTARDMLGDSEWKTSLYW